MQSKYNQMANFKETPARYQISQGDIANYQDIVCTKLTCIVLPDDSINCHDLYCDKQHHQHAIGDLCVHIVSACRDASSKTLPKSCPRKILRPYWSHEILVLHLGR